MLISTAYVGIIADIIDVADIQICLSDWPEEGNSEKEVTENAEEDSEKEPYNLQNFPQILYQQSQLDRNALLYTIEHHMEIPDPPPEY